MQRVESLHYLLKLKWNKLSNSQRKYLSDAQVDKLLNLAIRDYFEYFGHGRNPKGFNLGFEAIQQRTDMLNTLIKEVDIVPTGSDNKWVMKKPDNYGTYSTCFATAKNCSNRLEVVIEQHGDSNSVLGDFHRKPSKKWGKAIGFERGDEIIIHTDSQELTNVNLIYYKQPDEVSLGTYTGLPTNDNPIPSIVPHSDTDLPNKYEEVVVNLAIQNLSRIYEKQVSYQLTKDQIQTIN